MAEKLGVALSGGGFRAAFFHVGVLAQMAMLGLLRHVEVISTVSGGSIIGSLYYLHVKKLLEQEKTDAEITDRDYQRIVEKIEVEFLCAVQRNFRMQTLVNPLKNLRMARSNYSRSDRIGELYDEFLYRPVLGPKSKDMIEMRNLKISPKGAKKDFHPGRDNAGRRAKVPILVINTTSLNTGRNWRFEASRMGEAPPGSGPLGTEIDNNFRLGRPDSYDVILRKHQKFELGLAVAASAAVPGIFHPLAISDLYPNDIRVQLVDGGVHDNQGVQALLASEIRRSKCTLFVVSDASGPMKDEPDPGTGVLGVVMRANSITMDRIREEQLSRLLDNDRTRVAFMHLRKGLPVKTVPWRGPAGQLAVLPESETPSEQFGVTPEVQERLSKIRTDLDSFTEVEAYSLMLDGYLMSQAEFLSVEGFRPLLPKEANKEANVDEPRWRFLAIAPWMTNPNPDYLKQLEVGGRQLFKVFWLNPLVTAVTIVLALGILAMAAVLLWSQIKTFLSSSVTVWSLLLAVGVLGIGFLLPWVSRSGKILRFFQSPARFLVRSLIRALLPMIAGILVLLYLKVFDALFIQEGKLSRLKKP